MALSESTGRAGRVLGAPTLVRRRSLGWATRYQRRMVVLDGVCGLLAGLGALLGRFPGPVQPVLYVAATAGLPVLWVSWVAMFGGYDTRLIGLGSEEFRPVINSEHRTAVCVKTRDPRGSDSHVVMPVTRVPHRPADVTTRVRNIR